MKKSNSFWIYSFILVAAFSLLISSCKKEEQNRFSYWKGDIPNSYYLLNMSGERAREISGKPYMKLEYDPVTGVPIRCEFGLSEVTQKSLQTPSGDPAFPEPTLDASGFDYADKLDIKSPVNLLINWEDVDTHTELSAGGFEFTVKQQYAEYHFSFTFDGMVGEVNNLDLNYYFLGRESNIQSFKLLRKFNANY